MASPTVTTRIDWENAGTFAGVPAIDAVTPMSIHIRRGRNADFSGEAIGDCVLTFENDDEFFTPDRNWADNPSFEYSTVGWSIAAVTGLTVAATSITKVADNAPSAGSAAGEAVLTATNNSGITFPIPYRMRSGVEYSMSIWLKSMSGNLNVRAGIASSGTVADIASTGANITTSWAAYTLTWTPSADRTDAVLFVRTTTAAAATLRIDRIQLNPGASANTYLEAPTKGQLVPGKPVHIYATYSATDYAKFYGYIERINPDPRGRTVTITCYDPLRRMSETDVVVPANTFITRTARDFRLAILEDFERGTLNLVANPSFETDTAGWTTTGTSLTRTTTDAAPGAGSAYGSFVASAADQLAYIHPRMVSVFFDGQVYRAAFHLKLDSGTSWKIGIGTDPTNAALRSEITVTVTSTWTRPTLTYEMPATTAQTAAAPVRAWVKSIAAGTVKIDGVSVTRGQALYPYADIGTGRWANLVGVSNFDGGTTTGWYNGFGNLVGNPSAEVDASGWFVDGDAFTTASTSITATAGTAQFGANHFYVDLVPGTPNRGAYYPITHTFLAGVTYRYRAWVRNTVLTPALRVGIGSQGTPTDLASTFDTISNSVYEELTGTWTPSSNRTDVHFFVRSNGGDNDFRFDGAQVFREPTGGASAIPYSDTGPGGGGAAVTTITTSTTAKFGAKSLSVATPATAGAGVVYDFNNYGSYFVGSRQYILSMWVRPTSDMPYKVGIGSNAGSAAWDEATTTGTATASTWTQITRTWTPSADRTSANEFDTVAFVYQTDATARTFLVDGVRVIPGGTADAFEMAQWALATGAEVMDTYLATAAIGGTALSALGTINQLTGSRHWIEPEMAAPWYTYHTEDRTTFQSKASAATFSGDDIQGSPDFEIDRESIINIVPVLWDDGIEYYSDATSVEQYGPRLASAIDGSDFFDGRTIPDSLGPLLVARYKDPRSHPTITRTNDFPNQLALQLDDVTTLTVTRSLVRADEYVILTEDVTITPAGLWVTNWTEENYPY